MVCSGRNYNCVTITGKVFFLVIENELGSAFFDPEELVDGRMYFITDLLSPLQTHHH